MIKVVTNCGRLGRNIYELSENLVKIGCFEGTYKEARKRIKKDYDGKYSRQIYLDNLDILKAGGEDLNLLVWDQVDECKHVLNTIHFWEESFNPETFNWEHNSYYIGMYYPEYIDADRYNWEGWSHRISVDYIEKYANKMNWNSTTINYIFDRCPEKLKLNPNYEPWGETLKEGVLSNIGDFLDRDFKTKLYAYLRNVIKVPVEALPETVAYFLEDKDDNEFIAQYIQGEVTIRKKKCFMRGW